MRSVMFLLSALVISGVVACDVSLPFLGGTPNQAPSARDGRDAVSGEDAGVDCVDGINAATGAECDGGPSANQEDGETEDEEPWEESEEDESDETDDVECEDGLDAKGMPCADDDDEEDE